MNNKSHLQAIVAVIPVLSAGLYLMGATYHQGYLDAFGIDDSLFPIASDKALLSGFFSLITFGITPMLWTTAAFFFLFCTALLTAGLASLPRVKDWQTVFLEKFTEARAKKGSSEAMNIVVDKGIAIMGYLLGFLLVVISLLVVAVLSANSGQAQAVKEIRLFKEQHGNSVTLYTPLLPSSSRAKQIICSQSHCAFWLGSESLILRQENIERMVMRNPDTRDVPQVTSAQGR